MNIALAGIDLNGLDPELAAKFERKQRIDMIRQKIADMLISDLALKVRELSAFDRLIGKARAPILDEDIDLFEKKLSIQP